MKRVFGLAAILMLGSGGDAMAACFTSLVGTTANSESLDFGGSLDVPVAGTETCSVTSNLVVPDGYYGVFKADSRGNVFLDTGETASNSLTGTGPLAGQTSGKDFVGPADENFDFTGYYATGLAAGDTPFTADATVTTTGVANPSDESDYDSIELLMAYTSMDQQVDSFGLVGIQQLGIATHLDVTAGLLTGSNQPLEGDDEIGFLGGVGSYTLGVTGRYNLAQGFSVLGGASIVDLGVPGANASGLLGAGAVRFLGADNGNTRLFGEVGVQVAALGLSFSRHYEDGTTAGTDATGSGNGFLGSIYAKGGVLWAPDADNSVLFSATLKQGALGIGSLVEDRPNANPNLFSADLSGTSQNFTTVKGGADWTTTLAPDVDLTASLALGAASGSGASGDVFGVGTVTGAPQSTLFAEYGLRLGWDMSPMSRVDGFVAGSTGTGIGSHTQIGAAYHLKF